jgi:hypothetical protein
MTPNHSSQALPLPTGILTCAGHKLLNLLMAEFPYLLQERRNSPGRVGAGCTPLPEVLGESAGGRGIKERPQGQGHLTKAAQLGQDLDRQQGIPAQFEKVVVQADPWHAEDCLPDIDHHLLQLIGRSHIGL